MGLLPRNRKTVPNPTPTHLLFSITELVEKILLEVPAIDVLTKCRGVCKAWKDLIETSSEDLKYYSTSGLMRPDPNAVKSKPSRARPRSTPDRKPHPQLLTPIAIDILSIFWKRLAKGGITVSPPRVSRRQRLAERSLERSERTGQQRRGSSNSSMNGFDECVLAFGVIFVYLPLQGARKVGSFVRRKVGRVGRKRRAASNLGRKLIKEFTPVWQKVQIFQPHDPEFRGVLISAVTNWKPDSIDSWDYSLSLPKEFTKLPDAANALMTPLIEAIYSGKLLIVDPPASSTEPATASSPAVGIDLTYEFDELVARINRYDSAPKETLTFEAHSPFAVSHKYTRLTEDEHFTWGVSDNTLWRRDQAPETVKE
ncbi:hypothetical protein TWF281_006065 [Arthrobotrys megalospora]